MNWIDVGKNAESDEVIERLHHFGLDLAPNPEVDEEGYAIQGSEE